MGKGQNCQKEVETRSWELGDLACHPTKQPTSQPTSSSPKIRDPLLISPVKYVLLVGLGVAMPLEISRMRSCEYSQIVASFVNRCVFSQFLSQTNQPISRYILWEEQQGIAQISFLWFWGSFLTENGCFAAVSGSRRSSVFSLAVSCYAVSTSSTFLQRVNEGSQRSQRTYHIIPCIVDVHRRFFF